MMKFFGHLLALALATALSFTISSWIFDHTLWSSAYLEQHAVQTKLYDQLATELPAAFAAADPASAEASPQVLDPHLLQDQIDNLIPQFIDHLHKSGPAPIIDTGAFAAAIGQPAPDGPVVQSLSLGPADERLTAASAQLRTAALYAPIAVVVLVVLIILVMRDRRFPTLIRAAFETAGALLVAAALTWSVPLLLANALNKPTLMPIRTAITPFIVSVAHAIAVQFAIAAGTLAALAVILWLVHGGARLKAKFAPRSKPKPDAPAPSQ